MNNKGKVVLVFGSSGLVGSLLVDELINSASFSLVKLFVRKKSGNTHTKVQEIEVDFDKLSLVASEMKGDVVFICLGTTMAKAGSKEAFYKVDHTYCLEAARLSAANGVGQVLLISSMGADAASLVYYSKVKGEVERDIRNLNFESVNIVRPSLLLGDRKENRLGEKIFVTVTKYLPFIFIGPLKKYRPIEAHNVAKAMVNISLTQQEGCHIFESEELQKIALHS
ncbi:MAG TPA: NAD(P)H-binding protein [Saprospiraceae bacterium]|nr:NAD(P)H-binding protein [Saprospiraceae bacterium]